MTSPCNKCGTETETIQTSEGANDIFKCAICGKLKGVVTATEKINMVKRPCPFKLKWPKMKTPDSGKEPPQLDWKHLYDICRILHGGGIDPATGKIIEGIGCIGEENCPIYNGGIEKCYGK